MKKTYSLDFEIVMISEEDTIRTSGLRVNDTFSGYDVVIGDGVNNAWDLG